MQVDDRPEVVLVLGWGPACLMVDLLRELDHGLSALPPGSEIVFANTHSARDSLEQALQLVSLENIAVSSRIQWAVCWALLSAHRPRSGLLSSPILLNTHTHTQPCLSCARRCAM